MSAPQHTAGVADGLVYVVTLPSPQGWSHFGVVLAPVKTACMLTGFWHHFGWALAEGVLEGAGEHRGRASGAIKVHKVCCGRGPATIQNSCQSGLCRRGGSIEVCRACTVSIFKPFFKPFFFFIWERERGRMYMYEQRRDRERERERETILSRLHT